MVYTPTWECEYCGVRFKKESAFMNHECSEMIKHKILKTPDGILAYNYYKLWMEKKGRRAPDATTFVYSRYFTSFVNFVLFAKKVHLPNVERYIHLMCVRDLSPMLWCRDECYAIFIEWADKTSTPLEQAEITIETILDYSKKYDFQPSEFFSKVHYSEVITLIQQRKLSMWILLNSKKFKETLSVLPQGERTQLAEKIGFEYWSRKLNCDPDSVAIMKQITAELGI